MTLWAAVAGWVLAVCLGVQAVRLAHRLKLVAEADHELRGPVSALSLAVESLGRRPELSRRAQALDSHLDRLRLGLADLAAARSGRRAAPRRADVPLEGLARAAAEAWQPAARRSGGEIQVDWRAGKVVAQADRARLSQAIGNVLANAVEHGGGRIELRAERVHARVRLAVCDEGAMSRFGSGERSARQPTAMRDRDRGLGLGIAAAALEHARGSLEAPDPAYVPRRRGTGGADAAATGPPTGAGDPRPSASAVRGTTVTLELPVVEERSA
ncbi:MAG TPA: ATP-binding protein [Thermoleophilaceae bacterium]|nr:ATP-binding protein [Thermoleophilaceae bacterium]